MAQKDFNTQSIVATPHQLSEDAIQSLYAQIFLEYSLYRAKKIQLEKAIDDSLDQKNEPEFYSLTTEYRELLKQYEEGIELYEEGIRFQVYFEKH